MWVKDNIIRSLKSGSLLFFDDHEIADSPTVSMRAISLCPNIAVASSSFSWWAAYLLNHASVVAPRDLYSEEMGFVPSDYYPHSWRLLSENDIPLNVSDTSLKYLSMVADVAEANPF